MIGLSNILFIVEGERLEPEVINRMAEVYGLRCDISSVCTNIHILYQQLKQDDGYSDVIPVLRDILRSRLVSIYLRLKLTFLSRTDSTCPSKKEALMYPWAGYSPACRFPEVMRP